MIIKVPFDKIYPEIGIERNTDSIEPQKNKEGQTIGHVGAIFILYTTIRKKGSDGKWYLIDIRRDFIDTKGLGLPFSSLINFYKQVYNTIIRYKVDENSINLRDAIYDTPIIRLDPYQTDEADRMQMLMEP